MYFCIAKKRNMGRSVIPYFSRFKKWKLSDKIGSFLVILFCLLSQINFAQVGIGKDSLKATIFVEAGAEIFSTDETFNQQILNKEVVVESSLISYKKNKKVLKLRFAQSITNVEIPIKKTICLQKKNKDPFKNTLKNGKRDVVRDGEFKKYRFENNRSTDSSFFNVRLGRDCYVLNVSGFKASKNGILKTDFSVKRNLNKLYSQVLYFYRSNILKNSFLLVYSARPPPRI